MSTFVARVQYLDDTDPFASTNYPEPSRPPTFTFLTNVHLVNQLSGIHKILEPPHKLEDCALQLYKYNSNGQPDYGIYLDLESTLDDQWEELEGFAEQRKNTVILRTQLSVRVHAVIEKLLNSEGRELRRALFSLKQIFQDDKDLVHEFVCSDGLDCLIKVGTEADQNHQNYILRALGQVMLYVDGMNGVIEHCQTVQWLYNLVSSRYRLVVKTALKLLLVFVEYTEKNSHRLYEAVQAVDYDKGVTPFRSIVEILNEKEGGDSELCLFSMTLINKVLSGITDQDTFYDITDYLEEQGMEAIVQRHISKSSADLDLVSQLNLYEAALKAEDGDVVGVSTDIRKAPRLKSEGDTRKSRRSQGVQDVSGSPRAQRKGLPANQVEPDKELSSRVDRLGFESAHESSPSPDNTLSYLEKRRAERAARKEREVEESSKSRSGRAYGSRKQATNMVIENGTASPDHSKPMTLSYDRKHVQDDENAVLIAYRDSRRHRQNSLIHEQERVAGSPAPSLPASPAINNPPIASRYAPAKADAFLQQPSHSSYDHRLHAATSDTHVACNGDERNLLKKLDGGEAGNRDSGYGSWRSDRSDKLSSPGVMSNNRRWMLYRMTKQSADEMQNLPQAISKEQPLVTQNLSSRIDQLGSSTQPAMEPAPTVPPSKLSASAIPPAATCSADLVSSPVKQVNDISGNSVSTLKDKITSSQAFNSARSSTSQPSLPNVQSQISVSDIDSRWEAIERAARRRALRINDLDFTDLGDIDDVDVLRPPAVEFTGAVPSAPGGPPPPPMMGGPPPPPMMGGPPPPPMMGGPPPPPMMGGPPPPSNLASAPPKQGLKKTDNSNSRNKKTLRLHWREVKENVMAPNPTPDIKNKGTIWQKMKFTAIDAAKFEHLFETKVVDHRAKDEKQTEGGKKAITVLDSKRSNAINIGLTKLPPARTIKAAILKMDSTIINREGIEKLLTTMIPTEEEKQKIIDAQVQNPDVALGNAEQLLLTMSSISELEARLQLWAFKLDYDINEKEIAEPLSDLKEGIVALQECKTFKYVLSVLLSIGNFLNGANASGFHIDYLKKVPEVKDTVHKHSLLHHLCVTINELYPDSTDLYSEISAMSRCSKVDWDELKDKLAKLELGCRNAMDNLRLVAKHETYSSTNLKVKLSEFLSDCAERIVILKIVHKRMVQRFYKLLLYLGLGVTDCKEIKIHQFCKNVSEFALEYRTTREKVLQQHAKKKSYKERKKTRGKLIVDTNNFGKSPAEVNEEDVKLTSLLKNGKTTSDVPMRKKRDSQSTGSMKRGAGLSVPGATEAEDTGDELLESAFRSAATAGPRQRGERRRSQYRHRKSLRRTLKGGIVDEEGNHVNEVLFDYSANSKSQSDVTKDPGYLPPRHYEPKTVESVGKPQMAVSSRYKHIIT